MYHSWHVSRNKQLDLIPITVDLDNPENIDKRTLSFAVCHFITEIKKLNGEEYPPKTVYKMVICIQMHLETFGIFWKLLDDTDPAFIQLYYTCNNLMKEKASNGLRSQVK